MLTREHNLNFLLIEVSRALSVNESAQKILFHIKTLSVYEMDYFIKKIY